MALGGGTFVTQNKVLPGAYINFISTVAASSALSDRGIATMPLELDWGLEDAIFEVSSAEFRKNCMKLFGYDMAHAKMKGLRDLFANITTLYAYRLNSGGSKAANTYAQAKFGGVRGNDLKIVIQKHVDDEQSYDVKTVLDTTVVDAQTVASADKLAANDYVTFKNTALQITAGEALTGGTNGTVNGAAHAAYLKKAESYSFNALGVVTDESEIKALYESFCHRLRDEVGAKFQCILYHHAADYEGVVNVKNRVKDADLAEASLVYWVTGVIAGCKVNASNLNRLYDGAYDIDIEYTQADLMNAIDAGEFVLHGVGSDIRVLEDINSLVKITDTKGDMFKDNQTIRVIDQIANDIAVLFNTKYLGGVPNNESGRISLWADIIKHHQQLQDMRAIEEFSDEDVVIAAGADKRSIVVNDAIQVVNTMAKLYMAVTIE